MSGSVPAAPPPEDQSQVKQAWARFRALPTKVQVGAWIVAVIVLLGALGEEPEEEIALAPSATEEPTQEPTEELTAEPTEEPTEELTAEPTEEPTEEPTPEPAPEPATAPVPAGVPADAQAGVVERIVDGDTIAVRIDEPGGPLTANASHTIRLLIMDTPETVAPGQPVECGGPEATAFAERKLPVGSTVYLVADQEDTDRYGRFLRYVWTAEGEFFNHSAIEQGFARAVLYEPNDAHWEGLRAAAGVAKAANAGIWGQPCDYDAPPPPPPPAPAPAPAPAPGPPAGGGGGGGCDPNYDPCVPIASDVDCASGSGNGPVYVQGPVRVIGSDIYGLDGNNDGVGCEN